MDAWGLISWLLLVVLSVAAFAFLLYCCYLKYIHMKFDHIPGPPRDSFLLGHYHSFAKKTQDGGHLHDLFLEWAEKYGPVVRINGFHIVSLVITSPEAIKEFLMSPKYSKVPMISKSLASVFGVRCLGNGLVTETNYDSWHKQRRMMDPAFSRTYLKGLMGTFNEKAEALMEKLEEKADGRTEVEIHNLMCRVTLDVIAKAAFGLEINSLQDEKTPFPQAITMAIKGMFEQRKPFVQWYPGNRQLVKDVRESIRLLRRTGKECIERRKKALANDEEIPLDILTQILKSEELEEKCDQEIMLDNFVTFFIAGQDTTANQLAFAVMSLAREQEVLNKVRAEVDEVIGWKRDIDYEDLGKLQYLTQVLKETLRLYATAPVTMRLLENETVIEGVKIPANSILLFSMFALGRMDKFYKDPFVFDPDRFSPEAPKPYYTFFPFSLGPRSCIGQVFAQEDYLDQR
ncbi:cholesterol 24-hydroxylase-like isoform X2 [Lissotriton helveticus]